MTATETLQQDTGLTNLMQCPTCMRRVDTNTAPKYVHHETVASGDVDLVVTQCPVCGIGLTAEVLDETSLLAIVANIQTGVHAMPRIWVEARGSSGFRHATPEEVFRWYQGRNLAIP